MAIYDANGNFLRRTGDDTTQKLLGVMERHITQRENTDATAEAKKLLVDGAVQRNVTVNVLGDTALLTGETVVVRESATGLQGVFLDRRRCAYMEAGELLLLAHAQLQECGLNDAGGR